MIEQCWHKCGWCCGEGYESPPAILAQDVKIRCERCKGWGQRLYKCDRHFVGPVQPPGNFMQMMRDSMSSVFDKAWSQFSIDM